jgi:hypothetical protein
MTGQTFVESGENLSALAERVLGDPLRFPELLELNPNLNVFADLQADIAIITPEIEEVLGVAKPILQGVGSSIRGISGAIQSGDVSGAIGYAKEAIDQVGKLNGVKEQAESVLSNIGKSTRKYSGASVQLVDWLLENR